MGRQKKADIREFYHEYFIKKTPKKTLLEMYNITDKTYIRYVILAKKLLLTEITTENLERELCNFYNYESDPKVKIKLLDTMTKVWQQKHKIPADDNILTQELPSLSEPVD